MSHPYSVIVHQVTERFGGRPVALRESLREKEPCHADMLRYDGSFCNPDDLSQVVFPVWSSREGRTSKTITLGRWDSFALILHSLGSSFPPQNLDDWFTYEHAQHNHSLVRVTLREYKEKHPKYKLVGWRELRTEQESEGEQARRTR